jgi:hypothetical protein
VDTNTFWRIVDRARAVNPVNPEVEAAAKLSRLSLEQIVAFEDIFDQMTNAAYTMDLWGAAYTINGGASDDGFYYFRTWLVWQGRKVFEAALANPDSLASVVDPGEECESEEYNIAALALQVKTGRPFLDCFDEVDRVRDREPRRLPGKRWDFDDEGQVRRRFPRLAAMYLGGDAQDGK